VKELWKSWDEDVEGSGQVHPAILNNDLGVAALFLERQVYKKLIWEKEWSGGSKKDEEVYTILLTAPKYQNLLPAACALIEIGGVQWMESAIYERGFCNPNPH
jgi:hypothetical protein